MICRLEPGGLIFPYRLQQKVPKQCSKPHKAAFTCLTCGFIHFPEKPKSKLLDAQLRSLGSQCTSQSPRRKNVKQKKKKKLSSSCLNLKQQWAFRRRCSEQGEMQQSERSWTGNGRASSLVGMPALPPNTLHLPVEFPQDGCFICFTSSKV